MKELIIVFAIAIIYALIRAKHDSFISNGPWKAFAFIEGAFWAICVSLALWQIFSLAWWEVGLIGLIFGTSFWISFDMASRWHRARDVFHLGMYGWDLKMNNIFRGGLNYFIIRMVWLIILFGVYTGFMILI